MTDEIAAAIRAITGLVTGPPNLIGFDIADLRCALLNQGRAVFGKERRRDQTAHDEQQRQPLPI
jgi:cell division GTPase FtsZ